MNIAKSFASALHLSLMCFLSAGALADSNLTAQYHKCMDAVDLGAFKNSQWASCAAQETKVQDAILNSEYNKLIKMLNPEQRVALKNGQRSWIKFRDEWCRCEELGPSAPGGVASFNFCILDLTTKQINKLKEFKP